MKWALITLVVIVSTTFHSQISKAAQADNLKGVDRVRVLCHINERVRSLGISEDDLTSSVETHLRQGGLKVGDKSDDLPEVVVDIAMPNTGIFSSGLVIEISVNDRVTIERSGKHTWAPVWTTFRLGTLSKAFAQRDINAAVSNAEDALLNDVTKAN
ncbi:MAG TPA: hypothetical protein VGG19_05845 [Tepidisphaeraceae bacterium]|jgi:hypothetical protein